MAEAFGVTAVGLVLGTAAGLVIHRAGVATFSKLVGFRVIYRLMPGQLAVAAALTFLVTATAAVVPAQRAASIDVTRALMTD